MRMEQRKSRSQPGPATGARQRAASLLVTTLSLVAIGMVSCWLLLVGMGGVDFVERFVPWPVLVLGVLLSLAFMLTGRMRALASSRVSRLLPGRPTWGVSMPVAGLAHLVSASLTHTDRQAGRKSER